MSNQDYTIELILEAQNKASAQIKQVQTDIGKLQAETQQSTKAVSDSFGSIKRAVVGLGLTAVFANVGKQVIRLAGNLEQARVAFTTMLGSADAANTMLKNLSDFAKKTPFELTSIRETAKQLLAMGISAENTIPTLKMLGDISSGLNVPIERLALNFGQVAIQGKLTGRELRDFSMAGVPLIAELAKNLGVSEQAINDMVSKGKIGFPQVQEAFRTMTSEGGKFNNLMDAQSKTFQGMVSNMIDGLSQLGETIGGELLPYMKKGVEAINNMIQNNGEVRGYEIGLMIGEIYDLVSEVGQGFSDILDIINIAFGGSKGEAKSFFMYVSLGITSIISVIKILGLSLAGVINKAFYDLQITFYKVVNGINKTIKDFLMGLGITSEAINQKYAESGAKLAKLEMQRFETTKYRQEETNGEIEKLMKKYEDIYYGTQDKINEVTYKNKIAQIVASREIKSEVVNNISAVNDKISEQTKKTKELTEEQKKQQDQVKKTYKETTDGIEKSLDKMLDYVAKMKDLQKQISDLNKESSFDVASRYVEAKKELQDLNKEQSKMVTGNMTDDDRSKYLENIQKIKQLEEEIALAKQNTSQENIDRATMISEESPTEKIIREKQEKQLALQEELQSIKDKLLQEAIAYNELKKTQKALEAEWMKILDIDHKKQIQMYNELIQKARELAAARSSSSSSSKKAVGGGVEANKPYYVGENGPELFIPNSSGRIDNTANMDKGGGSVININMGGVTVRSQADIDMITSELIRKMQLQKNFNISA